MRFSVNVHFYQPRPHPPTCLALYTFECKILLSLSSSLSSAGSSIIINLRVAPKPIPSLLLCLPLEFQASIWSHLLSVFTWFYLYLKKCWWITLLLLLQLNQLRTDMSLGEDENTTSYPSSSMDGQGRVPAPLVVNTKEGWAHRGVSPCKQALDLGHINLPHACRSGGREWMKFRDRQSLKQEKPGHTLPP